MAALGLRRQEGNPIHRTSGVVDHHQATFAVGLGPGVSGRFEKRGKFPRISISVCFDDEAIVRPGREDVKFPVHSLPVFTFAPASNSKYVKLRSRLPHSPLRGGYRLTG